MAKLTIEIDMDDPQEVWDALYRRIEDFEASEFDGDDPSRPTNTPATLPATYDLLLDPERVFRETRTFFVPSSRRD